MPDVDREEWLHMYEQMFKIRTFEEHVNELYKLVKGPMPEAEYTLTTRLLDYPTKLGGRHGTQNIRHNGCGLGRACQL